MSVTPTFAGEIQLAGWSESHNGGCKVTFWLQSADDLDAFRTLTVRKGNTAGHRMMAALVEIGDDEKPVDPIPSNSTELKPRMGDACYRAVMWCAEPSFWEWANSTTHYGVFWHVDSAQAAKDFICEMCSVSSRKELDTDNEANKAWHRNIREPYRIWLEKSQA